MNAHNLLPQLQDGSNFNNWKFRLKVLLEEKDVLNVVENANRECENYQKNDAKARSIIIQCLDDKFLEIVKNAKTAADMLRMLEEVFERKSVFSRLNMKKKLLMLKYDSNKKLQDHFMEYDKLINSIESSGPKMELCDKVCHLLLSMPEEYDNVKQHLKR